VRTERLASAGLSLSVDPSSTLDHVKRRQAVKEAVTAPWRGIKSVTGMMFRKYPWRSWRFGGTGAINYAKEVGDGSQSSAVMAAVLWMARTFPEAPPAIWKKLDSGQEEKEADHDLLRLLERPNPYYSGALLWIATIIDWIVNGNAYWVKIRDKGGKVIQLWWVPAQTMEPWTDPESNDFITNYTYRIGDGRTATFDPSDLVHFRYGLDADDMRLGLSPLGAVLREVFTDEEAATFTATLLRNSGVPGLVISPDADVVVPAPDVEATKDYMREQFSGSRRGEPLVMSAKTKVDQFGFSPQQMNLRDLRRIPEERVTAVLGIPAIVAGLGAGLDRSTFANMAEAREAAYESNLIPAQRLLAEEVRFQLLTDFEDDAWAFRVGFDLKDVRVLQEDLNQKATRWNTMVGGGWARVADAKRDMGMDADKNDEIYLRPVNLVETDGKPRAEPPPNPAPPGASAGTPGEAPPKPGEGKPAPQQVGGGAADQAAADAQKGVKALDLEHLAGEQTPRQVRLLKAMQRDHDQLVEVLASELASDFDSIGIRAAEQFRTFVGPETSARLNGQHKAFLTHLSAIIETLAARISFSLGLDTWREQKLAARLSAHYMRAAEMTAKSVGDYLGMDEVLPTELVQNIGVQGSNRRYLVDIRGETREALLKAMREGVEGQESTSAIAERIRHLVPAGSLTHVGAKGRATLIARTETATAQRLASLEAYRASGVVSKVVAFDGMGDPDCAARNGKTFTFDQAEHEMTLEHPNGTLTFAPVTGERVAQETTRQMRSRIMAGVSAKSDKPEDQWARGPGGRFGQEHAPDEPVGDMGSAIEDFIAAIRGNEQAKKTAETQRLESLIAEHGMNEFPPKGDAAMRILGDSASTKELHTGPTGGYTQQRKHEVHDRLIGAELAPALAQILGKNDPLVAKLANSGTLSAEERHEVHLRVEKWHAGEKPKALFLAGGSGAGKSTALRKRPDLKPTAAVTINPDDFKEKFPEYKEMVKGGDKYAANASHDESSDLAARLHYEALELGLNIVVDGTGDGGPGKFASKLQAAGDDGYDVDALYVTRPTQDALGSAIERALETGRWVPTPVLHKTHRDVSARFPEVLALSHLLRSLEVFDTRNLDAPKPVFQVTKGKQTIHDHDLYYEFLKKAEEEAPDA
jgi:HK97 family phage portal protein